MYLLIVVDEISSRHNHSILVHFGNNTKLCEHVFWQRQSFMIWVQRWVDRNRAGVKLLLNTSSICNQNKNCYTDIKTSLLSKIN